MQTAESRIIDRLPCQRIPSHPNTRAIVFLGLMISLVAATGVAILLDNLDNGIRTSEQAEAIVRGAGDRFRSIARSLAPAFAFATNIGDCTVCTGGRAAAGRINTGRRAPQCPAGPVPAGARRPVLPLHGSGKVAADGIRYANFDDQAKVVMLTSALPGEGKSTLASNLALHAANTGEKVLMIDMDLRHPVLTDCGRLMQVPAWSNC